MNRRDFLGHSVGVALAVGAGSAVFAADASDPTQLTIAEASRLIRSRSLSPVELLKAYLERIHRLNPKVNAFIRVTEELAYQQAREAEAQVAAGKWRGPLHGIPVALKDNMDTRGIPTTAASAIFLDRVPLEDCEMVRRLKEAGAVILGKTNLHEFAYGDTTGISYFGPTRNPWNTGHVPGGSSGGSAAAVSARLCAAALGTDTGGSIRQPAAFCGVVGFKPTYGLTSIRGIVPLAETQDHVGPLCKTVADAALMLQVLAGYDAGDLWSIRAPIPNYSAELNKKVSSLRIGIPRKPFFEELDPQIAKVTEDALKLLTGMTKSTRDVAIPLTTLRVVQAEAYEWHRKFLDSETTRKLYQPRVLERLMKGAEVSAATYIDARRQQLQCRHDIGKVFEEVDLLITPTCPQLPVTIEEGQNPTNALALSLRNTAPFNANGIPTITVPCGFSREGLPIGLQFSGPALGEPRVLQLAHAYERATDWHERQPQLS